MGGKIRMRDDMLELKHLSKTYRSKDGEEIRALKDVTLSFQDAGLVFFVGKSGSGKSTLLNVVGGLDEATSGEFIVMGRSSANFSPADFDSYRNTFVGFVFQEYNVLNEFNVEENVSLALELQGSGGDPEKVRQILDEVGLSDVAGRKPNTLSGGQKQRVAIARALVKDPQIIMADEPTGALDSATGKQVFETLKALSKSRLVLAVSHDREFAENFGDRIIELKDGEVVSDVTKTRTNAVTLSKGAVQIGAGTLSVKCDGGADEETMETIRSFLSSHRGEVLLSKDGGEIASFKRANRIDREDAREQFVPTSPSPPASGSEKQIKFIRSKLPLARTVKIGFSGLKLKPVRLFFTVLLSALSFVMFGLLSTLMLYSEQRVTENSFFESDYSHLTLTKSYNTRVSGAPLGNYDYETQANFSAEEIAALGGADAFGAFSVGDLVPSNAKTVKEYEQFYLPRINRIACLPQENPLRKTLAFGTYPERENQIAVSEYFLECMQNSTFTQVDALGERRGEKAIQNAEDLIGERIVLGGYAFEVSGVFKAALSEKYRLLKNGDSENWVLSAMYQMYLDEGLPTLALVSDSFVEAYGSALKQDSPLPEESYYFDYTDEPFRIYPDETANGYSFTDLKRFKGASASYPMLLFGEQKETLESDELVVPYYLIESYYSEHLTQDTDIIAYAIFESSLYTFAGKTVKIADTPDGVSVYREATEEEWELSKQFILSFVASNPLPLWQYSDKGGTTLHEFRVAGIYGTEKGLSADGVFCSDEFYRQMSPHPAPVTRTKYTPSGDETFDTAFLPLMKDADELDRLLDMQGVRNETNDVTYTLQNILYTNILLVNEIVGLLKQVFLWSGLALALFAALLLFNFISVSITGKKKEIGILRAVGARGTDIFRIFFAEAGMIVGICTLIAVGGSFALVAALNAVLRVRTGLDVTLFVFGPLSALLMIAVALVVAFASTFLPVFLASRKKPVENIRAL